ncbi:YcaO-like family protein [Paracoccus aminophilus]|uniref:YcaO domain-containing protein n=1 Tax=Paracoccus aminophilus JCM 7686 TaxID=1367847 RepID=S5YX96_PARAH|nr:YcaO-like family protein [Paracoccus aminophilus]AGT09851.1 hypothetical protein JCM7686_2795 [Paracoccus aminophilus JCM 7686]
MAAETITPHDRFSAIPILSQLAQEGSAKGHRLGCHRRIPPAETVARLRPLLPAMGITRIADLTGLDRIGVPVAMVCRPNARSLAVSQGKGLTIEAATASGVMEAAEFYHAEHIELPLRLGSVNELSASLAFADLARLPRISDLFHPDLVMLWVEGWDLVSGAARWLPFESVRGNFTLPPPPGSGCFDCGTNGLASGNSTIEAICHAICELVERDGTALWHARGPEAQGATGLDLGSVDDPACREVLARLEAADFDVLVWETTTDLGIASFFALISDRRAPDQHLGLGAGTHPTREIALLRALTEAVQVRMTYISGARDDLTAAEYLPCERQRRARTAQRWREDHRAIRRFDAVPGQISDSFAEDLDWLLGRLGGAGLTEVVAVDLGKPALGLAVVRVVIAGLEGLHDHPAYQPGPRARAVLEGRA